MEYHHSVEAETLQMGAPHKGICRKRVSGREESKRELTMETEGLMQEKGVVRCVGSAQAG